MLLLTIRVDYLIIINWSETYMLNNKCTQCKYVGTCTWTHGMHICL